MCEIAKKHPNGCFFAWRRVWDSNPRAQRANGFQDRLVMTTSITLRIKLYKAKRFSRLVPFRKYSRAVRLVSSASSLLIFVTRFKKRYSIVFCALPRYDRGSEKLVFQNLLRMQGKSRCLLASKRPAAAQDKVLLPLRI